MADPLDWYRSALGGDVGTGIPLNLDRTPVPDTGQGAAWSHLTQAPGDILQSVLGLLERGQLGGLNALGLRSPGSDIYRAQIPVEPGLRAAEGAATFATGGLASSLFPAAGALRAGAQYAVPPGTLPGLLADEMGGIRAFHGSPHDFDRFDLSKIGTGEGAQAYGHGLYFAENEGVARGYRDAVKNNSAISDLNNRMHNIVREMEPFEAGEYGKYKDPRGYALKDEYDKLMMERERIVSNPGHMYEVDINADPKAFLDWDKPLSRQPTGVQEALGWTPTLRAEYDATTRGVDDALLGALKGDVDPAIVDAFARRSHELNRMVGVPRDATGADIVKGNSVFDRASDAAKSAALREAGIPGVRYLDQGSRGAGQGSSNYAVFDDSLVQILRKYGLLPPVAGAGLMGGDNQ